MAIAQDTIITVGSGATEKSFGVSKTLDQYSLDELKTVGDWAYSAYNDNIYNANLFKVIDRTGTLINIADTESAIRLTTLSPNQLFTEGYNLQSEGVFFRNVLVYWEVGTVTDWSSHTIFYGSTSLESKRIVTDIELQDLKISITNTDINAYNSTYTTCKLGVNDVAICPMQLLVTPDNVYLNMALPFNGGRGTAGNMNSWLTYQLISYDNPNIKTYTDYKNMRTIDGALTDTLYMAPNGVDFGLENGKQNKTFTPADSLVSMDSYEWGGYRFFRYQLNQSNLDKPYIWHAYSGVKFELDGVTYKPIVQDGMITGYTDDMSEESEWDSWENIKDHVTPSVRPTPGPSGDDEDNADAIITAGAPYARGLVNYYAMTAGSVLIDHISEALSTWDLQNTGKDLYKNLVSCKLIKPPAAIPTTGSEPLTIYGEKPQYQGADISLPVVSGNPDATFGPYSISRKFNDFRDYAPYTRVCIFLPYCGWCDLPSHVVGRSVTVKYFTDIIAATVRAVVFCNNNIIAEAAGVMGLDIPFTADAVGMKQAGVVSGLTAYAGGALQTAAGVASIVTTKGGKGIGETLSGASKLVSAYTQTAIAFNENTTEISGKNGDGCCLSGATNIIIKIIRPKYGASSTAPFVPAGFAHAVGFVSNKEVRVGNVSGLLIADNVDTSGIAGATDAERAEIKRVLESGLIVNAAPE